MKVKFPVVGVNKDGSQSRGDRESVPLNILSRKSKLGGAGGRWPGVGCTAAAFTRKSKGRSTMHARPIPLADHPPLDAKEGLLN